MKPFFTEEFGNPSTLYGIGRESKKALNLARQRVAELSKYISLSPNCLFLINKNF